MTVKNSIEAILETKGISHRQLARQAGYTDTTTVLKSLSRNSGMGVSVNTLIKWLDELDYQIVLQSVNEEDDDLILDGCEE